MSQNYQNNRNNSERVCQKLYKAVSVSPFKAKTFRISHQPNFSKNIPVESGPIVTHFSCQKNKKQEGKEERREIVIVNHVPIAKAKSSKKLENGPSTNDDHESKFSDYITKVKKRMINSVSSIGRSETRRDSFDERVTNYISNAKMKIRTTTNVGDQKSDSYFK